VAISKPCFFPPQNVAISKPFFSPPKNVAIFFFLGNFPKCLLHHLCFHGGLFNGFSPQKNKNKNKN
jgi:hypothetical protein